VSVDSRPLDAPALVDASTLAQLLGVSRAWVYEHAGELGALALGPAGEGKRPRLRFDPDAARAALSCWGSERSQGENASVGGASEPAPAPRGRRWPSHRPQPGPVLPSRPRKVRGGE